MSLGMKRAEREAFLAETRVAVVSIQAAGRGPLTVPVWHDYEPGGDVRFVTGGASLKARPLHAAGRMSLCVQEETPPYRYVSIEGPVTIERPDYEHDIRRIALRYLGPQMGEMYLQATAGEREGAILVRLRPERWLSVDYRQWNG
jgi:PPOX class probable F420-dependent enzyme